MGGGAVIVISGETSPLALAAAANVACVDPGADFELAKFGIGGAFDSPPPLPLPVPVPAAPFVRFFESGDAAALKLNRRDVDSALLT